MREDSGHQLISALACSVYFGAQRGIVSLCLHDPGILRCPDVSTLAREVESSARSSYHAMSTGRQSRA